MPSTRRLQRFRRKLLRANTVEEVFDLWWFDTEDSEKELEEEAFSKLLELVSTIELIEEACELIGHNCSVYKTRGELRRLFEKGEQLAAAV